MNFISRLNQLGDMPVCQNYSAKNFTSYRLGGKVKYFALPSTAKEYADLIEIANDLGIRYRVLGNGSNVLVADGGYNGLIICTKNLKKIYASGQIIYATCGVSLSQLIMFGIKRGLGGAHKLIGIPATVGGATYMNAGAFGCCIADSLCSVKIIDNGKLKKLDNNECEFGYRKSIFQKNDNFILESAFKFNKIDKNILKQEINATLCARKKAHPSGRNCGSVFSNGVDYKAGELIDKCGLKGLTLSNATVSPKHANFIIANYGATASSVYNLICFVKNAVYKKFGVMLNTEVEFIGDF